MALFVFTLLFFGFRCSNVVWVYLAKFLTFQLVYGILVWFRRDNMDFSQKLDRLYRKWPELFIYGPVAVVGGLWVLLAVTGMW